MARKIKREEVRGKDDSKLFAFIATFFSIIGFIVALVAKKDDKYVMFYAKQSLVVFITSIILGIVGSILAALFAFPMMYNFYGPGAAIKAIFSLASFLLWLVSWIYALSGDIKEVPIVGRYARKLNF